MSAILIYNTLKEALLLLVLFKALKFFRSFDECRGELSGFAHRKGGAKCDSADKSGYSCKFCGSKSTTVVDAVTKGGKNMVEVECGNCGKFSVTSLN